MGILRLLAAMVLTIAACLGAQAQTPQPRIALVIGQSGYTPGKLPTALNDAGLMAQAFNDSGFEIVEGSDLDLAGMRQLVQDFLDRVEKSGPDTAAAVYISGYSAQLEGDNYLLPVDARIVRESDIAMAGFRLSDLIRSLNAATNGAKIVIVDTPRGYPALRGKTVASGLVLAEPPQGMLIAYATAPGNVVPDDRLAGPGEEAGDYGIYARALADQIYQPGLEADEVFKRVRMQVHEATAGVQIPWHGYALAQPFHFMSGGQIVTPAPRPEAVATPEEAYAVAIERDTITGYQDFLKTYPDHPLAKRVKVLLANRREAVFWNRTVSRGTADAYWTYLKSYPKGPHVADARRRLAMLSRPVDPPADFPVVIYRDIPAPIEIETVYETTYIYNDYREYYDYPPPPPPPVYILPPLRPIPWQPPVKPARPGFLPAPPRPAILPVPAWRDRAPPPRVAPLAPGKPAAGEPRPGMPIGRPDMNREPPATLPRPSRPVAPPVPKEPGQVERPVAPPAQKGPGPVERPVAPPAQKGPGPVERPVAPPAQERPAPVERPAAPPVQKGPGAVERPAPPPVQERPRPVERPAPPPVQERPRPVERPAPPPVQERPRPVERPAPPPVQERPRPVERPAPPAVQERPRPVERPAPPPVQERPRPVERPAPPPVQERPRPVERPAPPPVQERPRPAAPAPQVERPAAPPPVMERPKPQPEPQRPASPDKQPRRPGEPQQPN